MSDARNFKLINDTVRANAKRAIDNAPDGYSVRILEPKRSLDQNAKMWSLIHDVARSRPEGRQWTPEVWKSAMLHSIGHQVMFAEGLDGSGPFPIGFRSSNLTVNEMSRLIEQIYEYGQKHGVEWSETIDSGLDE